MTNPNDFFRNQPNDALLWIYASDQTITGTDQDRLLKSIRNFIVSWTSHERSVTAEVEILMDRFLIVSAHLPDGDVSGCGIDKLVNAVVELQSDFGFTWLDGLQIPYKSETGDIVSVDRSDFRRMVNDGTITGETLVYDTSLHTLGDLRTIGLERSARNSWHARVFSLSASVSA